MAAILPVGRSLPGPLSGPERPIRRDGGHRPSHPEPFAVVRHHPGLFWAGIVAELGWERAACRVTLE